MVSGVASGFSSPIVFSQRQLASIQYDHDHTPEGCSSCQPKSEKASDFSASTSGKSSTKGDKSAGEVSAAASRSLSSELTAEEKKEVAELQKRDQEVRLHEQAHLATAGAYARGGPSFTYEKGPDGRMYAVGGEVPVDVSPVTDNPQATIQKAAVLQRAALAPADPSGADRQIAAKAAAMATKARQELARQSQETIGAGKKVSQKQTLFYARETSSPASDSLYASRLPPLPTSDFSPYLQQKPIHSSTSSAHFLNIYV